MNIKQLKILLSLIDPKWDEEENHHKADRFLLEYINDSEVTTLFDNIKKWYA